MFCNFNWKIIVILISLLKKNEEEYFKAINTCKEKVEILQRKLKKNEETNSEISEELATARNRMKLVSIWYWWK